MKMLEYRGYVGLIEADDGAFVGWVAGLRDVVTFEGATFAEVEAAFRASVDDYLAFCAERGEPPGLPFKTSDHEKLTQQNVEAFQRFCDAVGERAAERGLVAEKIARLLADD